MAYPLTRSKTFVAGVSEIEADEMNDMQDAGIQVAHGSISKWFPLSSAAGMTENEAGVDGGWVSTKIPTIEIALPEGTVVTAVTTYVTPDGTTAIQGQLSRRAASTGTVTAVESPWSSSTANTRQGVASGSLPYTVAAGETLYVRVIPAHADAAVHGCWVTFHKLIV